jgi:hypothetical protein
VKKAGPILLIIQLYNDKQALWLNEKTSSAYHKRFVLQREIGHISAQSSDASILNFSKFISSSNIDLQINSPSWYARMSYKYYYIYLNYWRKSIVWNRKKSIHMYIGQMTWKDYVMWVLSTWNRMRSLR